MSVDGAEVDRGFGPEPHRRVEGLLELGLHPVQEPKSLGLHFVEAEQSVVVVQEDADSAACGAGGKPDGLICVDEAVRRTAAAKTPRETVVSQPALIGRALDGEGGGGEKNTRKYLNRLTEIICIFEDV